ncbi:MAG: Hsp20/alpha crystallin family protein [Nitrospirae bacterium]|nr:Hsp20/alpha crystallin family protein [Nitrospirota bacterium]MBI5694721.1 Hsp20/alpha crystallin family protein [Nitrospirota bacterium]
MTLVPWDPFKNLMTLQDRMNRLFDETVQRGQGGEPMARGTWLPPVDIYETDEAVVMSAELPGMDESDVDIQVRDNTLTIKGERKLEKDVKEESYHRVERTYGAFTRSFTLPATIDQDGITASYKKGVLEIRMPKSAKAVPQQIKISITE